jgi:cellulose synthase/poly-beta-1,6-N-acetylglucosamine synthase-like glycosyltransferase
MTPAGAVLGVIAIMFALPVAILLIEVFCAVMAKKGSGPLHAQRPIGLRVAVLIPAHDEEEGIGATVSGIAKQLGASDRLIVVADNCTDGTAERALAAGAEIIERFDPQRRGKGYALDFGVRHLESDPPDIVVIIDADCRLAPGTIDALVARSHASRRAVQASYGMGLPPDADAKRRVAGFAWIVKNHVRPMGLAVMGLPSQLMGTGMAFPWEAIRRIELATGNIVEDVRMGLDLAAAGYAPIYCPDTRVESDFPTTEQGFAVQRRRWETGSLRMVIKIAPAMFLHGLMSANAPLMAMAVDLMVPPLMMLLATLVFGLALSCILGLVGGSFFPAATFCCHAMCWTCQV